MLLDFFSSRTAVNVLLDLMRLDCNETDERSSQSTRTRTRKTIVKTRPKYLCGTTPHGAMTSPMTTDLRLCPYSANMTHSNLIQC